MHHGFRVSGRVGAMAPLATCGVRPGTSEDSQTMLCASAARVSARPQKLGPGGGGVQNSVRTCVPNSAYAVSRFASKFLRSFVW